MSKNDNEEVNLDFYISGKVKKIIIQLKASFKLDFHLQIINHSKSNL